MAYFRCWWKALFYKGLSEGIVKRTVPLTIWKDIKLRVAFTPKNKLLKRLKFLYVLITLQLFAYIKGWVLRKLLPI
jgi:hypothetical protein